MRVLVTGGTGVIGEAAVRALVDRGHEVRLVSRHAKDDVAAWPTHVEAWPADVGHADQLRGAADGCDAILHITGIVAETPPESTFERINVGGTRNMLAEAARARVNRFVYVSSLGAERGESDYHKSKAEAEQLVRGFAGNWTIVRPGNVYGPGDDVISLLLKLVRSLPTVPVIGGGDQPFQPIWTGDVGAVLAEAVERDDLKGRALDVAGPDRTSMNDLLDRLSAITNRAPSRLPLPSFFATLGTRALSAVGVELPVNEGQLTMLDEGNVIPDDRENALHSVFAVTPTSLDEGLAKLADAIPEQLPDEGFGALKRKSFWADIEGSELPPETLLDRFREQFATLTPWTMDVNVEPGTPSVPRAGETLTMKLPLRGNIQVRVEELEPRRMTLVTLEGHPLAGAVRFLTEQRGERVRFEVQAYDRASNVIDWLSMLTVGGRLQDQTWTRVVENAVALSGGVAPEGVRDETVTLDDAEATRVSEWLKRLVVERKREERESDRDSVGA